SATAGVLHELTQIAEKPSGIYRETVLSLINEEYTQAKPTDTQQKTLENFFDCWLDDNRKSIPIQKFFESFASKVHSVGRIKTNYNVNLFADCLKNYADISGNRRKFTLNQIILLYSFVLYRQNLSVVSENEFRRRVRIINNLILNSPDQISDSEDRQGGNRMPAILRQVDSIILDGEIADSIVGSNFNPVQLEEERMKLEWTKKYPNKAEMLFELEDHELLYGQISIVGLEHPEYFKRFESLFNCDWDLVDCALFTIGDYKQKERNGWRYQLGSYMEDGFAWVTLFHKSDNYIDFDKTQNVLCKLLNQTDDITDDYLEELIDSYTSKCESNNEYPWTYYYIKYEVFRTGRYGKYWWRDFDNSPYVFTTLHQKQKTSENSYNPFLKAVDDNVMREYWGNYIDINEEKCLTESQRSYLIVSNDEYEEVIKEYDIAQNEDGVDTEDRIKKMRRIYNRYIR
ncbi:MAG: hypothetical protein J6V74_06095, partial [Bacteroidales bacterium]|nr:hypothetical protein [Bacteroidales bacterium]